MRTPKNCWLALAALCVLALVPAAVSADDVGPAAETRGARIPTKVVAGKLVISCDLSTRFRRVPVNLFVELDTPCGLQLHNQAAQGIRAENRDGSPNEITIHLPDLDIKVPKREHGPTETYEDFTKLHADKIGEVALVGTIGQEILKQYFLAFDLGSGFMRIAPPNAQGTEAEAEDGVTVTPITLNNDLVWLPVSYANGKPAALAVGSATYDTVLDEQVCEGFGKPAGNIGALKLGTLDLGAYVAFRPEEVAHVHPDGVAGVLGLNLLEHLRVEIDRVNRWARITPTKEADYPEQDFAFFEARVADEGDAIEAYLEKYPDVRLSNEAAHLLIDLRLDEDAEADVFERAIKWVNKTYAEDLRATAMVDLMKTLGDAGRTDAVITAGELGIESGRKDRYPDAVHKIHSKLGAIQLERGADRKAWKHLLSAAFGMPEDGLTNLNLGRYYEKVGRYRRAYSRYVQAVIKPESGPAAADGLKRLQDKVSGEERYSVDLVERLIGGKVLSFGAATKYKADKANASNRTVLLEFFTNAHLRPAIGGALGNEGLMQHFPRENVAMLAYHLPAPEMEPMVTQLAIDTARELKVRGPFVHRVDGLVEGPGAARAHQREALYNYVRRQILQSLPRKSDYTIDVTATLDGDVVKGTVTVKGPYFPGNDINIVVAERGVLFPGKSEIVIHRMVVRGAATKDGKPVRFKPKKGQMVVPFEVSLKALSDANRAFLDRIEQDGQGSTSRMSMEIDPGQVTIVAFLRGWSGEVHQAAQVEPEGTEEARR
ncbi:MAG: tetratricopeptide repeat protein [Planctomycetota bacterium]|nr:tetratricopeptide repeat protein [Planctomycetota bacterium]